MKKIVPDPPVSHSVSRRNPDHDLANEVVRYALVNNALSRSLVTALKPTAGGPAGTDSPFTVRPGISAEEALLHVSMLLKAAEEVSDEITEQASGVERGLIWSLVHSVEMARGVVDALLDGNRRSPS
ncbi:MULTISPECIES: DUF6124 family protein [Pseudomonas]|uniref:DUF6124 family protein n=1 Tax=Pseudomonas TaxID=286 RepID=UPI0009083991|nr:MULTISPECIES: hypothetical protein [Pseudomonas]APC22892.1 hypothetical protein BME99_04655 [Pseudomonas protegens]MBB1615943.1 hypothetical protein [Pseudomonas sp. UMC65]MBB1620316.1 hypothetical protein [Pseudomonas sp. UME65]MBP5101731.1 hypothetical protein [Pseudomonas protegens]MBP5117413.1 hypothetical protein [Pseudomonas protegens]